MPTERSHMSGSEERVLVDCERCHGDGEIKVNPGYPDPQCEIEATCPDCHGEGYEVECCGNLNPSGDCCGRPVAFEEDPTHA